jgi:hypothetical protein
MAIVNRDTKLMRRTCDGKTLLHIVLENIPKRIKKERVEGDFDDKMASICPKLMERDEINERHLQEAIKFKSEIPTPDIVEIENSEYEKLYPETYKKPRIRIFGHRK